MSSNGTDMGYMKAVSPQSWGTAKVLGNLSSPNGTRNSLTVHEELRKTGQDRNKDVELVSLLRSCVQNEDLHSGDSLLAIIINRGLLGDNPFVSSTLITMYARRGALEKAYEVLEALPVRDVVCWSALILGYAQQHSGQKALNCFKQMQQEGLPPNDVVFICILKACCSVGSLEKGEIIHAEIVRQGLLSDNITLGSVLVDMYVKWGALAKAQQVLEGLPIRDIVTWNTLIVGYVQRDHDEEALSCFELLLQEGFFPSVVTYVCILKAFGNTGSLKRGRHTHSEILLLGLLCESVELGNTLVDMYAKCGALLEAKKVFDGLTFRTVVSWCALIAGYVQGEHCNEAFNIFKQMVSEGLFPDGYMFACILKACGSIGELEKGEYIHSEIVRQGLLDDILGGALVDMYVKCGALAKAKQVLEGLPFRNVVSWSALIAGYAQREHSIEALDCFERMQNEGLIPNAVSFACIFNACGSIKALDKGKAIHYEVVRHGLLEGNVILGGALVDMYVKCGALVKAEEVHEGLLVRDVVSWNALIAGYAQEQHGKGAINCFERMQCGGLLPDSVTFTNILKACGSFGALEKGENLHLEIVRQGLLGGNIILGSTLVNMYAKCGAFAKAKEVLEGLSVCDSVLWNALLTGYAQTEQSEDILHCFERMQCEGFVPSTVTFICILKTCASIGALDEGKCVHSEILRQGLLCKSVELGGALVNMYAKCGAVAQAKEVLEALPVRNVVSWSALISGYAQSEQGKEALDCLERMKREGLSPNTVTFTCALKACGSTGALNKGKALHSEIVGLGLIRENIILGSALVDMYGKCGACTIAREVFDGLGIRNVFTWNALISGYAQGEHGKEALSCFHWMLLEGLCPDEVTFICVLCACSHSALLDEGQTYFSKMSTEYGIPQLMEHHTCMLNLFGCLGYFDKVVGVIDKMPISKDHPFWAALLNACKKWGNMKIGTWAFGYAGQMNTL